MPTNDTANKTKRCVYVKACYLAEGLQCFGYKSDCALYQESTGKYYSETSFNAAMDALIDKTVAKHKS